MTDPISTKYEELDLAWVDVLAARTGLKNRSEIIRRAVRVLALAAKRRPDWNWIEETANPIPLEMESHKAFKRSLAEAMDKAASEVENAITPGGAHPSDEDKARDPFPPKKPAA